MKECLFCLLIKISCKIWVSDTAEKCIDKRFVAIESWYLVAYLLFIKICIKLKKCEPKEKYTSLNGMSVYNGIVRGLGCF